MRREISLTLNILSILSNVGRRRRIVPRPRFMTLLWMRLTLGAEPSEPKRRLQWATPRFSPPPNQA